MKKNIVKTIKFTSEMDDEIKEISEATGFKETDLIRFMVNRTLEQFKADKIKAGGYKNLEITIKQP